MKQRLARTFPVACLCYIHTFDQKTGRTQLRWSDVNYKKTGRTQLRCSDVNYKKTGRTQLRWSDVKYKKDRKNTTEVERC